MTAPAAAAPQQRKTPPPPAGAARWSKTWVDAKGLPHVTTYVVPVDANDRKTAHVRFRCRGHEDVTLDDGKTVRQQCSQDRWVLPGDKPGFCPDHGCELDADEKATASALPLAALWKQMEPSARPLYALAAVAATGAGLDGGDISPAMPMVLTPVLAAGAYRGVRTYLTRRSRRVEPGQTSGRAVDTINRRARHAAYLGAATGAWLTAAAACDPTTLVGKTVWTSLPIWWAICSAPWWKRVETRRNEVKPDPGNATAQAVTPADKTYDPQATLDAGNWATTVATGTGLPNTHVDLDTWAPDTGGRRMVVRARQGALTDERIKTALPLIAAAFDVRQSAIGWIAEYEGSPRSAQILVQPNSHLDKAVAWQPPSVLPIDDAVLHVGTQLDGTSLYTRLWTPGWGAPSRSIFGTKGSGKTEAIRLMMLGQLLALVDTPVGPRRLVAPFLHDPKLGKDFGAFRRQVCGFTATPEALHMVVDAIIREMDRRYDSLATFTWRDHKGRLQEGEQPFDPAIHGPIISLWIDEFHEPSKDKTLMEKLEPCARKMRAAGIEINTATHMTTLSDMASQAFRDMVAEEVFLFRTTSGLTSLATGGQLTGDPRLLPRVPGSLYHAAGEQNTVRSRFAYVPRDELYDLLYDDNNRSKTVPVVWPPEALEAFGRDFVEWMRASQERTPGSAAPAVPKGYVTSKSAPASAEDGTAADGLQQILLMASGPMTRKEIGEHAGWRWSVTQTLTNAINAGLKANPPWLLRHQDGKNVFFTLAPAAREQAAAVAEESREEVNEQ